jgi:NAD(P)-dependent dehydrogenase (short-subunit alcohol dehydrogenase family)
MNHDGNRPLQGKVAVVTGGGRGIGEAISRRLAEMGATTVICGRLQQTLEAAAQAITSAGGRCEAMVCDVSQLDSVEALAARVQTTLGGTDILVNNAGVGDFSRPLHQLPPEIWDRIMNTNLRGVYYMIRAFAPMMINAGHGDIVNISSIASKNPLPKGAAYAASKWGLNGLSYSVAEELRGYNIRVSVVCPGSTQSELSPHEGRDALKMLRSSDVAHVVEMIVTQAPQSFASEIVLRPTQKP